MTKMIFNDKMYHRELVHGDLSTALSDVYYYDNVLCGDVSGVVDVYSYGLPSPFGQEFSFYFPKWEEKITSGTEHEKKLAMSLSANNGWGKANDSCFKPL